MARRPRSDMKYTQKVQDAIFAFGREPASASMSWQELWEEAGRRGLLPLGIAKTLSAFKTRCLKLKLIPPRKQTRPRAREEVERQASLDAELGIQSVLAENRRLEMALKLSQDKRGVLLDICRSELMRLPRPKTFPKRGRKRTKFDPEEGGILLSDFHYGSRITREDTSGLGEYSAEIAERRLRALGDTVERLTDIYSQWTKLTRLNVFNLGDNIEGTYIYKGQSFAIDTHLVRQLLKCACLEADLYAKWAQMYDEVRVYCVPGNHGRMGEKFGVAYWQDNFDTLLAEIVAMRLADWPNIHIINAGSQVMGVEIQGHRWLLSHGNNIPQYLRMPWYGIETAVKGWISVFSVAWDYVLLGHFHREASFDVNTTEVLVNGSFPGASELSINRMRSGNQPKQLFFGIHPKRGITARYPIVLERQKRPTMSSGEFGVMTPVFSIEEGGS